MAHIADTPTADGDSRADESGWLNATYQMIGNAVCPPLVAALGGAVLAHSDIPAHHVGSAEEVDWVSTGLAVAVRLALSAVDRKESGGAVRGSERGNASPVK